mmetsp:Transcript_54241/g.106120  ORF Transcript_54241/g.106120 Transcript_54241/m.106120 type:complete len:327 (-) Transcript_54241:214-1194(-)
MFDRSFPSFYPFNPASYKWSLPPWSPRISLSLAFSQTSFLHIGCEKKEKVRMDGRGGRKPFFVLEGNVRKDKQVLCDLHTGGDFGFRVLVLVCLSSAFSLPLSLSCLILKRTIGSVFLSVSQCPTLCPSKICTPIPLLQFFLPHLLVTILCIDLVGPSRQQMVDRSDQGWACFLSFCSSHRFLRFFTFFLSFLDAAYVLICCCEPKTVSPMSLVPAPPKETEGKGKVSTERRLMNTTVMYFPSIFFFDKERKRETVGECCDEGSEPSSKTRGGGSSPLLLNVFTFFCFWCEEGGREDPCRRFSPSRLGWWKNKQQIDRHSGECFSL